MTLECDPPNLGDIGDDEPGTCDFAGTLHPSGCDCGAYEP